MDGDGEGGDDGEGSEGSKCEEARSIEVVNCGVGLECAETQAHTR